MNTDRFVGNCGSFVWFSLFICSGAAVQGQELKLLNPSINTNSYFQSQLVASSGSAFTIEVSTDLIKWSPEISLNDVTSSMLTIVDPKPFTASRTLFYRAKLGTTLGFKFSFVLFVYSEAGWEISPKFPISISGYRGIFEVDNDSGYPAATNVFFTGPSGSGVANSPADPGAAIIGPNMATYQSLLIPSAAAKGIWTVNYKGTNVTFDVPDPETLSRFVVPVPTFQHGPFEHEPPGATLVSWAYADATTGVYLPRPPTFIAQIQVLVPDQQYESANLAASKTNLYLPISLDTRFNWWKTVFTYKESLGNTYRVTFSSWPP